MHVFICTDMRKLLKRHMYTLRVQSDAQVFREWTLDVLEVGDQAMTLHEV